jgi:hypothetical protein
MLLAIPAHRVDKDVVARPLLVAVCAAVLVSGCDADGRVRDVEAAWHE